MHNIADLTREEKRAIQRDLIRLGFLDPLLPGGDPADDGIWGPVTDRAYQAYWASRPQTAISVPMVAPAPVRSLVTATPGFLVNWAIESAVVRLRARS